MMWQAVVTLIIALLVGIGIGILIGRALEMRAQRIRITNNVIRAVTEAYNSVELRDFVNLFDGGEIEINGNYIEGVNKQCGK